MVGLLKTIGIIWIIGSLLGGLMWNDSMGGHGEYVIPCAIVGVINCIICFALAKCVKAATVYLDSVTPKEKSTSSWLKETIFDEEPTDTSQQY